MFEGLSGTRQFATPYGPAFISFDGMGGLSAMPRFDSSMLDGVVDRLLENYPAMRADAQTSGVVARGLEHVFAKVYEVEFPRLRATEFLPLNTETPPGAKSFTYRMSHTYGQARVISDYGSDLPMQGFGMQEWPSPLVTLGAAYGFSVLDLQRAGMGNVPLEALLAKQARFAIEFLAEQIYAVGLPNDGVPGFTNAPGVVATTKISAGTWLAQIAAIAAATAAAPAAAVAAVQGIIADVNAMTAKISTQTLDFHNATDMLLPLDIYNALKAAPRSPAFADDSILTYIAKMTGLTINPWVQLNTAGASSLGRVMVYEKNPDVVQAIEAQPFTQLPPQPKNLMWQVPCLSQIGGVMAPHPLGITYMDGCD